VGGSAALVQDAAVWRRVISEGGGWLFYHALPLYLKVHTTHFHQLAEVVSRKEVFTEVAEVPTAGLYIEKH
jgi:hypothetical protein